MRESIPVKLVALLHQNLRTVTQESNAPWKVGHSLLFGWMFKEKGIPLRS
jgi:hypothetical protein